MPTMTLRFSGAAVQAARKAAGMSQRELANATGIPLDTLREYERNKYAPSAVRLALLASTLGVPMDSLFEEGEEGRSHDAD